MKNGTNLKKWNPVLNKVIEIKNEYKKGLDIFHIITKMVIQVNHKHVLKGGLNI
jgi:hypothetical protein